MSVSIGQSEGDGVRDPGDAESRKALIMASSSAQVREVATAILLDHVRRGRRGLAICGASSGIGVTLVTMALAIALAQAGVRVLVVEANLRRPGLHALAPSFAPDGPGLLALLSGEVDEPSRIIHPDVLQNLSVIYAGGELTEAADVFDTDRFENLVAYAMRTYDLTLIDTPPANRCAESRRIAAVAGYAAIVARRDVTMSEDLGALLKDLRLDRTEVIGSIFNEG